MSVRENSFRTDSRGFPNTHPVKKHPNPSLSEMESGSRKGIPELKSKTSSEKVSPTWSRCTHPDPREGTPGFESGNTPVADLPQ